MELRHLQTPQAWHNQSAGSVAEEMDDLTEAEPRFGQLQERQTPAEVAEQDMLLPLSMEAVVAPAW